MAISQPPRAERDARSFGRDTGDNGSEALLSRILVASEEHVDWLESQVELVNQLGDAHYLAQQIRSS